MERAQRAELHEHYALRQAEDLRYLEAQIDRLELSAPGSEASSWQATREELDGLRSDLRAAWEGLERLKRADPDSHAWREAREAYLQQHTRLLRRTLELMGAVGEGQAAAP
ncbi:MAG TPA: hypothetical protein VFO83_00340 [Aggregicoccus sp.]|nr:hypothetical protein [Aggregicoccus sp.]